jgi:hypothetical protein
MRADFIQSIGFAVFKLVLLAVLVVLGIVFVPETAVDYLRGGVDAARVYLWRQAEERGPVIKEDIVRKTEETKDDAKILSDKFLGEQWPRLKDWFTKKFIY